MPAGTPLATPLIKITWTRGQTARKRVRASAARSASGDRSTSAKSKSPWTTARSNSTPLATSTVWTP
jgi:hypothetical protein